MECTVRSLGTNVSGGSDDIDDNGTATWPVCEPHEFVSQYEPSYLACTIGTNDHIQSVARKRWKEQNGKHVGYYYC